MGEESKPQRVPQSDLDQWKLASLLVEQEEDIVGYLADQRCIWIRSNDPAEVQRWMNFTLKIETIIKTAGTKPE